MKKALYLNDCYLKEFEAKVESVQDEKFVVLNQTAFYPKSGGQSNDAGFLIRKSDNKKFKVIFVGKFNGQISHEIEEVGLQPEDEIMGQIDWQRRYLLMRYHTAAHIISSIINKETGALITGNQLEPNKGRIDFNLDQFDKEALKIYIEKANEITSKDIPIKIYTISKQEAEQNPKISKLAMGLPSNIESVRIVDIENLDTQADGGTHVKSTQEVGKIEFLKAENKGKNNRRLYFRLA